MPIMTEEQKELLFRRSTHLLTELAKCQKEVEEISSQFDSDLGVTEPSDAKMILKWYNFFLNEQLRTPEEYAEITARITKKNRAIQCLKSVAQRNNDTTTATLIQATTENMQNIQNAIKTINFCIMQGQKAIEPLIQSATRVLQKLSEPDASFKLAAYPSFPDSPADAAQYLQSAEVRVAVQRVADEQTAQVTAMHRTKAEQEERDRNDKNARARKKLDTLANETFNLVEKMRVMDDTILQALQMKAKVAYDNIRLHHVVMRTWINILKEAFYQAEQRTSSLFDIQHMRDKKNADIVGAFYKGAIAFFLSPLFLGTMADPFFKMADTENTLQSSNSSTQLNTAGAAIMLHAIVSQNPISIDNKKDAQSVIKSEVLLWLEKQEAFLHHKLTGMALTVSKLFDQHSKYLEGFSPKAIIAAQRIAFLKTQYRSTPTSISTHIYASQPSYLQSSSSSSSASATLRTSNMLDHGTLRQEIYHDVLHTMQQQMNFNAMQEKAAPIIQQELYKNILEPIFNAIDSQYPDNSHTRQIDAAYKALGFDDSVEGPDSFKAEKIQTLITVIANHAQARILVMYLILCKSYFGGVDNPSAENFQAVFLGNNTGPINPNTVGQELDQETFRILEHLATLFPDKQKDFATLAKKPESLNTLRNKLPGNHADIELATKKDIITRLIKPYIDNANFYNMLSKEILRFAKHHQIDLPSQPKPKPHAWVSEARLNTMLQHHLGPYIQAARMHRDALNQSHTTALLILRNNKLLTSPSPRNRDEERSFAQSLSPGKVIHTLDRDQGNSSNTNNANLSTGSNQAVKRVSNASRTLKL